MRYVTLVYGAQRYTVAREAVAQILAFAPWLKVETAGPYNGHAHDTRRQYRRARLRLVRGGRALVSPDP